MRNLYLASFLALCSSTTFAHWNFSTCGATGATGPTQAACDTAYAGTNLSGKVTSTNGIQSWTVPVTGIYRITAVGGQGASGQPGRLGGRGADLSGEFNLNAGAELRIAVGQQGLGQNSGRNGGGGGGSFIVGTSNEPMVVAGGGGGTRAVAEQNGCDASLTEYGIGGNAYSFTSSCTTKTSGLRMGGIISSYSYGSAGAGFDTNGQNDAAFGTGGASWFMGLSGGKIGPGGDQEAQGGFGGGGAGDGWYGGGGGGGYSGGDGGLIAGGAGSFNAGANSTSAISTGSGDGLVSIMLLGIQINVSTLPIGQVGSEYPNTSLSAMGGYAPYNWSATGLPNGMSLSNTGVFSGAPTQYGNFSVEVTVADSSATPLTKTASFPLTIIPPSLTLSTSNLSIATIGTSYTQTIMATGGVAPYSWSATGLPNDLTINQETGTISGIPTTVGSSEVTVSVSDDAGQVKTASFTIVVDPLDLTFVGAGPNITLASGVVSTAYSQPLQVTGGLPPYTFSVVGELPPGLALDSATGVVSGTPTTPGSYTFSVGVADTVGAVGILLKAVHVAEQTFTIVIAAAPVIQGTPTPVPALGSFVLLLLSGAVAGSMGYMRRRKSI